MALTFQCPGCAAELVADDSHEGKLVTCELCGEVQVVPDKILENGDAYQGFVIDQLIDSNIVWNSYLARPDEDNDHFEEESVYLKIPSVFLRDNLEELKDFINSICRYASLNVKEFIPLLRRSGSTGDPFFIFKYEESLNLTEFVDAYAPLNPYDALAIIRMVSAGMESTWELEGETHQNLKPSLIRVNTANEIRIEEFGVSNFMLDHPRIMDKGLDIWNVRYMSPEFLEEGVADSPAVDIFALGRIFHLLLTGQEVFADETRVEVIQTLDSPNPLRIVEDIPADVVKLYNDMVARNPNSRISAWTDLSKRIDAIFEAKQRKGLSKKYKTQRDIPRGPSIKAIQRGHNLKSVGTRMKIPDDDTARIDSESKGRKAKKRQDKTHARLLKQQELAKHNLSRKWKRATRKSETKSFAGVLKENMGLIVFSLIALAVAGVVVFFAAKRRDDEKSAEKPNDAVTERTDKPKSPAPIVAKGPTTTASQSVTAAPPSTAPVSRPPVKPASGPTTRTLSMKRKIADIESFLSRNPKRIKDAIAQYQALIDAALRLKDFDALQVIKERIAALEKLQSTRINETFDALSEKALDLWENGKREQAMKLLDGYEGEFAKETKLARLKLLRTFNEDLELERERREDKEKREQAAIAEEKERIKRLFNDMADDLVEGRANEAINAVQTALEEMIHPKSREFLNSTRQQLILYASLPDLLMDKYAEAKGKKIRMSFLDPPVESAMITDVHGGKVFYKTSPTGTEKELTWNQLPVPMIVALLEPRRPLGEDDHLLKGLIATRKRLASNAAKSFRRLPLGLESSFSPFLNTIETQARLTATLRPFGIHYDPLDNTGLFEQLTQKNLTAIQAKRLFEKLQAFIDQNGEFLKSPSNAAVIDALVKFCNQHAKQEKTLSSSITISESNVNSELGDGETTSTSAQLIRALSTTLGNRSGKTTLKLAPGRYSFPRKVFDLSSMTLVGGPGVIFSDGLSCFGDDAQISGVTFKKGGLKVTANSKKLTISDCVFTSPVELDKTRDVTLRNNVFRGLVLEGTSDVTIDHCVILSPKQGISRQGALWLIADDVTLLNSVIVGDHYAVVFTSREDRRKKVIENCVWLGEKGFAVLREDRKEIDPKSAVTKPLRLRKYCRPRDNVYESPQFVAPSSGDWRLVDGSPGDQAAADGSDCGLATTNEPDATQ